MMSSFYCILLFLCVYDIFVLADKIVCKYDENIMVELSKDSTLLLQNPTAKFEYDNNIEEYTNRTISSVHNTLFMALTKQQSNQPFTKTVAKFTTINELRAFSDMESHGLIDERKYCSVTLMQEPSIRVGMPKKVEAEMRKALVPCLQHKLCESSDSVDLKGVIQKMKYRADSKIAQEKLQDTVNALSDFIISRLAYSITNKRAKIPPFNGTFNYPVFGGTVYYTVFNGSFYNPVNFDRLMDTHVIENNNDKAEVDIAYRLRDINTKFEFKLSDRTYEGQIDVNISKIVFSATMTFDYTACQAKLDILRILNVGELEYEIAKGLAWYENMIPNVINKVVYKLVTDNLYKIVNKVVSLKIENFQCGAQRKEAIESITKLAVMFGKIVGSIVKKYVNDL